MRFSAHRTPRARRLALAVALGGLMPAAAMLQPIAAHAQQEAERDYAIPAGPLSGVLARFGAESGLLLSADAALLEGRHSAGLKGRYSGTAALRHLLAGSGLEFRAGSGGLIVIEPAAGVAPRATLLREVQVTARPDSLGTNVIDRERLDAIGAGNGDITSALRVLPNIQYDNNQLHTGRQGEIAPAEISIHGAKFYDNQFLFDGMSFSNDLDPTNDNPNSANTTPSSSQGLAVDTSLLCNITVRDSNVPAEYGHFSGGVVSADTCAPTLDFGGRVSMEITRSDWMEYKLTESQKADYAVSTSDSKALDFDKKTYRVALQGRPTENLGLIGSYVLKTSEIPLKAYAGGAVSAGDDSDKTEKRRSENLYLRGFWNLGSGVDADFALSYAPATGRHFVNNTRDSWFDIESGGQGVNLGLRHRHDAVAVSHRLTWNEYESSRDADATTFKTWRYSAEKDWGYRSGTQWNSQEGQYGDIDQKQQTWNYQLKADWTPFKLGTTEHAFQTGLEVAQQRRYYERLDEAATYYASTNTTTCMTAAGTVDTENCSLSAPWNNGTGQFLASSVLYRAGKIELDNTAWAAFGQYELGWERVRLRLGARYEDDDLAPEATVSPRSALFWDVFGDASTRFEAGANRYYSRNFLTYHSTARILALQTAVRTRRLVGGVISDWNDPVNGTALLYRTNDLKVPYSDEHMLGLSQHWAGALWGLKWVAREGRDEVVMHYFREGNTIARRWENAGKTSARTAAFTVETERPLQLGSTATSLLFSVDHTDIETSHADYNDTLLDTNADPSRGDSERIVRYDGKFIRWIERPADNYNRPVTARLLLSTSIPAARLTIGNLFRYRDSYRKFAQNGTVDYGGTQVANYEKRTFRPSVTWDMRINYDLPTFGDQTAFVALSIDNVLNRSNEIEDDASDTIYEKGRQFWIEFGYRF